jgi:hypothetical protein
MVVIRRGSPQTWSPVRGRGTLLAQPGSRYGVKEAFDRGRSASVCWWVSPGSRTKGWLVRASVPIWRARLSNLRWSTRARPSPSRGVARLSTVAASERKGLCREPLSGASFASIAGRRLSGSHTLRSGGAARTPRRFRRAERAGRRGVREVCTLRAPGNAASRWPKHRRASARKRQASPRMWVRWPPWVPSGRKRGVALRKTVLWFAKWVRVRYCVPGASRADAKRRSTLAYDNLECSKQNGIFETWQPQT